VGLGDAEVGEQQRDRLGGHRGAAVGVDAQLEHAVSYTVGTLVLLVVCKGIAYAISLSSFRGGPTFPGMFIGAAGGIALSHLAGLPMIAGAAIGVGAMTAGMLLLPMTALLLTTLFFGTDGIKVIPLVIVGVVVSFVLSKWLAGPPRRGPETAARFAVRGHGRIWLMCCRGGALVSGIILLPDKPGCAADVACGWAGYGRIARSSR
jgi:hypothetical protein